ncbi:MAG: 2,3-bisphosphoglycerate-independent phosphoglycerate mutase, partial [Candidatus Liptonbacteria bacterium]|nr:2,3-bisphosphoglycerate-independent phosphoglycerate mutase [Candidatus Liptonbacteria bacterium]
MDAMVVLMILDGWGIGPENESNPVYVAQPETFHLLQQQFPMISLQASGIGVGLPWGEVGNSEVGHLTLGAGKVLYQYYPRIVLAIRDKSFFANAALAAAFRHAKTRSSSVNLVGLLSDGNVHAAMEPLEALIGLGEREGVPLKLHLFSDGKDAPPHSIDRLLGRIPREKLATLTGRYYAMDRKERWTLTERAYDIMTDPHAPETADPETALQATYAQELSEEFLAPVRFGNDKRIQDGDALIFLNFREDSMRQLVEAFLLPGFSNFPTHPYKNLYIATMTRYEER